ncbi:hypothetical protein [Schleiferilactobacillus harbinensis]|uniref:hypothetical protein n=1 Tax=Schleiferilactobacillus harbinensis TaxID=304207 RepID=UPI0039E96D17
MNNQPSYKTMTGVPIRVVPPANPSNAMIELTNPDGGEPPMDSGKYVTKKQLKKKLNTVNEHIDLALAKQTEELTKEIDSRIAKAKLQALVGVITVSVAIVGAIGWIVNLIISNAK